MLHDSEDILHPGLLEHYIQRPDQLEKYFWLDLQPCMIGCIARVEAFGATGVQYFCELDENSRRTLIAARTRRSAWQHSPNKDRT